MTRLDKTILLLEDIQHTVSASEFLSVVMLLHSKIPVKMASGIETKSIVVLKQLLTTGDRIIPIKVKR